MIRRNTEKRIGRWFYPFFMLFISFQALAQSIDEVLQRLAFDQTREVIAQNSSPSLHQLYQDNLNDCLQLILEGDEALYETLSERYEQRLEQLEEFANHEEKDFYASELRLQWSFIALKYDNQWKSFWSLRMAKKLIDQHRSEYPNFELSKRTKGLIEIVLSLIPENFKWITNLFDMEGDFNKGYDLLKETTSFDSHWGTESRALIALVNAYLLEERSNTSRLPKSPLYNYLKGLIALKQHEAKLAMNAFDSLPKSLNIRNYLLAEAHFLQGHYSTASELYGAYLSSKKSANYRLDALMKQGLALWFQEGDLDKARIYFELSRSESKAVTEIDRNAKQLLKQIEDRNPLLLELRYVVDGGNWKKATALLKKLNRVALNNEQRIELQYRIARFYQLQGQYQEANLAFLSVINADLDEKNYIQPYSYLQLGRMAETQHNVQKARAFYQLALDNQDHPYVQSIRLKAKLGLSRLSD